MKKEDLEGLGLTEEQIADVQKLNGKDIAAEQRKTIAVEADRDNFKEQLTTAQESLKGFEGIDIEELNGKVKALTEDLQSKEATYQKELSNRDFNTLLESQIAEFGAKSAKAVRGFLDIEALKASKEQTTDIKNALEAIKTDNDYLFNGAAGSPTIVKGATAGNQSLITNPWKKDTFNLTEQGKIFKENPDLAKQLMNSK